MRGNTCKSSGCSFAARMTVDAVSARSRPLYTNPGTVRVASRRVIAYGNCNEASVISLAFLCVLGSAVTAQRPTSAAANTGVGSSAKAQLLDSEGRGVGEAVLRQSPHGVLMSLTLTKIALASTRCTCTESV